MLSALVIFTVMCFFCTAALFASLFILDDDPRGPFKTESKTRIWQKCAAIVVVASLCKLAPFGGLLALAVYLGGIIVLFERSFGQALGLMVINIALMFASSWGLVWLAAKLTRGDVD